MHALPLLTAGCAISVALFATLRTQQPEAQLGHFAFVVGGDRDQLAISHVVAKADPWAGNAKGMVSEWRLEIHAADGALLETVLLDMSPFATAAADKGRARRVEGCIVIDSAINMLVNAPRHADAASYDFFRGATAIGHHDAAQIQALAEARR